MSYMNFLIRVSLDASPEQKTRLRDLQRVFAQVCNELAPHVQQTRVWNRVALHHLHYRTLRGTYPSLGSQMVCNAIYSVSKMARLVYGHPDSPFNTSARPGKPLPLLRFAESCPVYFDRHTLSVRSGKLSMYTLDGRIQFEVSLSPEQVSLFGKNRLREIVLDRNLQDEYQLSFHLIEPAVDSQSEVSALPEAEPETAVTHFPAAVVIPAYVSVEVSQ